MGRVKIQMRKIVDRQQRNIAFAKRKSGLLKKAYELFVLCNVQMVLIFFSPSGKLFLFDTKTRMEETIKKYVDVPIRPRPRENFDDGILLQTRSKEIEDEIFKCKAELAKVEQQLGYFLKHPNQWGTRDDIEYQEKILEETLDKVRSRKKCLEAQNEAFDASNCLLQTDVEISPSG
uniref:MADS-box domain-containing protein n=1 Tax=Brassica campestris TaxID=3711 RepID=M4D5K6_BRACM